MKESDIPINFLEKSNIKDNYNLDDIEFIILDINNKIRQKYIEVVKNKIINHTSYNFNVYKTDQEFLCPNNFIDKVIFDLKNINLIFYLKKNVDINITEEAVIKNFIKKNW